MPTLAELIQNDQSVNLFTKEDWSQMGRGLLTEDEAAEILSEGYEEVADA